MMPSSELEKTVDALRMGKPPPGTVTLKKNPVRHVARVGDTVVKLSLVPRRRAATREATALTKASARGIPVPDLVAAGEDWIATGWIEGRGATRDDLPLILPVVERMHRSGMLHCDLHLGNFLIHDDSVRLLDVHRARFWPAVPRMLRRWELGRLRINTGAAAPVAASRKAHASPPSRPEA
jgi:hypothetical protein